MGRPPVLTDSDKAQILVWRAKPFRWSYKRIGEELRHDASTIHRFVKARDATARIPGMPAVTQQRGPAAMDRWEHSNPPPKSYEELSSLARECLQDFPRFCDEILGESLHAHQVRWHHEEQEAESRGVRFNMRNVHPRSGKTDKDCKKAIWRLCGGGHPAEWYEQADPPLRDARIMLVAGAENQSDKNFDYIAVRLAGHGRLVNEYGRFKVAGNPWRPSSGVLTVDGRRRLLLSGDYSLVCVGTLSHVLGRGADHIVCDDPFDTKNTKSPEQAVEGLRWLRAHIFSRLEPGGTITVLGAKLPVANEPYSEMARWPGVLEEDFATDELLDPESDDYPRLFHTVVEPAVLDWDNHVVLCAERFTWAELMTARRLAGEEVWEASWMQNPQAAGTTLAQRVWIYGGADKERLYNGCMDSDRRFGESISPVHVRPDGTKETLPSIRAVSVDPSDKKFWGIHCLDLFKTGDPEFNPILVDLDRNKHSTGSFLALLGSWHEDYDFRAIVLERNISKFLLENDSFTSFTRARGIRVLTPWTGENKLHPVWGIGTLRDDFKEGRIRIPNADTETRWKFGYLVKEALGELGTDDTLLSLWFAKYVRQGLLAMASESSGWQGWAGAPGPHRAPPPRVARQFAGVGR